MATNDNHVLTLKILPILRDWIKNASVKFATTAGSAKADGGDADTVNKHTVNSDVPANAKFTDNNTTYTFTQDTSDKHKIIAMDSNNKQQTITVPDDTNYYVGNDGLLHVKYKI